MGHPARRQRRVRRRHGGGGRVSPPARSGVSIGLPGRDLQTKETRVPIPARPGRPRTDYEYERNGTANIFLLFAPLEGWRHVEVTDRHAAVDYAHLLRDVSDRWYPNAAKIALFQDNLSTRNPASLYEGFSAGRGAPLGGTVRMALHAEARQLVEHGRNRTQRVVIAVSGQTHCHRTRLTEEVAACTRLLAVAPAGQLPPALTPLLRTRPLYPSI